MKSSLVILSLLASISVAQAKNTVVLVHGALFTGAGWAPVQSRLQNAGRNVVVLDVPGRLGDGVDARTITIDTATAKLCTVVKAAGGPVVLVGHSQGGALITQAVQACGDSIRALVYVAAVVPKNGETAFDGLDPKRDVNFGKCVVLTPAEGIFKLRKDGPLEASFFADLRAKNPELADYALAGMVSEPLGIGTTKLHYNTAAFERLPKYYVEATKDEVVTPPTQRRYQTQTAFEKVYRLPTSHSPFLVLPDAVAGILEEVARTNE